MPEQNKAEQNYANHAKRVPLFIAIAFLTTATFIGSLVNLFEALGDHSRLYNAALISALSLALWFALAFCRNFALKAQDRAVRAEEKLRYFILTGKPMDPRLTMKQIIGLRFASDAEFPELARKAVEENLSLDAIKRAVKNWRPDHDRA